MATDVSVLAKSLPGLEIEYSEIRKVFSELESFAYHGMNGQVDEGAGWQHSWDVQVFEYHLKRLRLFIQLAFEAADLPMALKQFDAGWAQFSDLSDTSWLPEVDSLASEPLDLLQNTLDGIRVLVSSGQSPIQQADATRLRRILEATAYLLHHRNVIPTKEKDIQDPMDDYLGACFLGDYVKKPQVPGFVKNFNADGGVKSLATAIEFKFVTSETEMKRAVSGIFEDTAGYKGSKDWTTFYSVIYQTQPFAAAAHLRAEMRRVDGYHWTPIVVVGGGGKSGRKIKAPKGAPIPPAPSTP